MARKVKFSLEMADGTKVRNSLEELREHFDIDSIARHFVSGKLQEWLSDRYYDNEAEEIGALSKDETDLNMKLCQILGVEASYSGAPDV